MDYFIGSGSANPVEGTVRYHKAANHKGIYEECNICKELYAKFKKRFKQLLKWFFLTMVIVSVVIALVLGLTLGLT